jgi:hypothetical protein
VIRYSIIAVTTPATSEMTMPAVTSERVTGVRARMRRG